MPTPTHSGSRPRIGLASSVVWATDRVIGGRISRVFPGIAARQGITLGRSAEADGGKSPRKPGFRHISARRLQQSGVLSVQPRHHARPRPCPMKRLLSLAWLAAMAALPFPEIALAQHAQY